MSDEDKPVQVVLFWHMHQPEYRAGLEGDFQLPWTYLHGLKDYTDMAAHLEDIPGARAVVNFAPTLLEQLDAYARQTREWLVQGRPIHDPLLRALVSSVLPETAAEREVLVRACLRANEQRLIHRFPAYQALVKIARRFLDDPRTLTWLSEQFLADLLVWYHLAWMGETVRREGRRIQALMEKERNFSWYDRRTLLEVLAEQLAGIIPRYRSLAQAGRVELSFTPFAHPIIPLLLDFGSAREAMPDVSLPKASRYPGGEKRARWHIEHGMACFERHFGFRPRGCWPAEGSLSDATVRLLGEYGIQWVASGEQVLRNSIAKGAGTDAHGGECHYRTYRVDRARPRCFFRDDGLSDLIGFEYSSWHADDAVANLLHNLENIGALCADQNYAVVPIVLDGENAWESYPDNGYHFLRALYAGLAEHPKLNLTTFGDCLRDSHPLKLPHLVAGSWVYGSFSTWIGDPDKNRAWDMLVGAKHSFDNLVVTGRLSGERLSEAEHQLAVCEGSDWFWWFGDYNPGETVEAFDLLFREQLACLYRILEVEPPDYLHRAFSHGGGDQALGGVMRRNL